MDLGKHVYVQKPLCWSVQEARHLAKKATETKVATQMGNQGHSQDEARRGYEYIAAGRHRRRPRSARLDEPSARLLAAGHSAPGAAAGRRTTARHGTTRASSSGSRRRWAATIRCPIRLAWDLFLGVAPDGRLPPALSPVQLARLGGLGPGRARRHGRAPDRSPVLGARSSASRRRSRRSRRRSTASAIRTRR